MNYNQAKKQGKRIDYVYDLAKTDKGMTAKDTVRFHLYNPNGNYALCIEWGSKAYDEGNFLFGIDAGSYEYKELSELTKLDKPRWWDVRYYVDKLYKEAVFWAEKVKEVENRTDEEKKYVSNLLGV